MQNSTPFLTASVALLIATAAIAKPTDPLSPGVGANPLLRQVNNGTLSITTTGFGFEENKGQVRTTSGAPAPFVRYHLTQGNTSIFLLGSGIAYQFNRTHFPEGFLELRNQHDRDQDQEKQLAALRAQIRVETYRMDMMLEGADPDPRITTEGRSADCANYYNHDALGVHKHARITFHDVYPGIDWIVYTTEQGLKYDFVVHVGADPARIQLGFKNHEELSLDDDGRLIHGNRMGRFMEERPVSYQDDPTSGGHAAGMLEIPTRFLLQGDRVAFDLGSYDPTRTLIIDPARIWATYCGGTMDEEGSHCAVDPYGNVYLAGTTSSISGIASGGYQNSIGGFQDAFLVKYDPNGNRLWGTYYGGTLDDRGLSCAADPSGNVYLTGSTESSSSIASGGHQNSFGGSIDAFLVKFDPDGTRLWGTYFGGSELDASSACAVDPSGNLYLAGGTESSTNIASGGQQNSIGGNRDALLVKFDPNGVRLWATYYGGLAMDAGTSCAIDSGGNVYLAGWTSSLSGIASGGHQNNIGGIRDAFLVKLDPAGIRLWASYYGGASDYDQAYSCAVDPSANVYLAGDTESFASIASGGHQNTIGGGRDGFLAKFDSSGTRLWGTYYGGTEQDYGRNCAVDHNGNVYLSQSSYSTSGIANGGHQNTIGGSIDGALVKFDPFGTRLWASYYGGADYDTGESCAADPNGDVYLVGSSISSSGIADSGHQNFIGGLFDAFLVKFNGTSGAYISDEPSIAVTVMPNPTADLLTITVPRTGLRYMIVDEGGRVVLEGLFLSLSERVDLSSEPAGLYLFKIWDLDRSKVIRFIKQ